MKPFKHERDWQDLERADKIAMCVGILMFFIIETGLIYRTSQRYNYQIQSKDSILKTLVTGKNR